MIPRHFLRCGKLPRQAAILHGAEAPRSLTSQCLPSQARAIWRIFVFMCAVGSSIAVEGQNRSFDFPVIHGPLSLQESLRTGRQQNNAIKAAQAETRAAVGDRNAARSRLLPQLSATTYLSTGDANNILSTSPGVMPANYGLIPPRRFADQNLTLMAPLYTGGLLESQVRAANEKTKEMAAGADTARADVGLRITDAYLRALLGAELVSAAQARMDANAGMALNARAFFEAGKGIEATVQRAEAELADAQRMLTSAKNESVKAELDLKAAMGVSFDSDFTISDSLQFAPSPTELSMLIREAAKNRPELIAARAKLGASRNQASAARASYQPQIYGAAMADGFAPRSAPAGAGYTLGITISIPLLDSGLRRAEVSSAKAMQERAEAESRDLQLRVEMEVRQAWLDVQTAAENYRTSGSALKAAQSAYDVIALRVQNQKSIQVEQLDALAALIRARVNVAQALYDHSISRARLRRASGQTEGAIK